MWAFLTYFVVYFAVPRSAYLCAIYVTGSGIAAWVAAIVSIPLAAIIYERTFRWAYHRWFLDRLP